MYKMQLQKNLCNIDAQDKRMCFFFLFRAKGINNGYGKAHLLNVYKNYSPCKCYAEYDNIVSENQKIKITHILEC